MKKENNSRRFTEDELLTPEQLAKELAVSQAWIRDHVSGRRKPLLPHIWLGEQRGMLRFRRSAIAAFLEQHSRSTAL
jgi:Helix-turn-helix domain